MKRNSMMIAWLCIVTGVSIAGVNYKKAAFIKRPVYTAANLAAVKNTAAGLVCVQLIPGARYNSGKAKYDLYNICIMLKRNQPIRHAALMQYMNFGIKNNFCAVLGTDTLTCVCCERIPGISGNEFLYLACFGKPAGVGNDNNLYIYIKDTAAGFGITGFEINNNALKNKY